MDLNSLSNLSSLRLVDQTPGNVPIMVKVGLAEVEEREVHLIVVSAVIDSKEEDSEEDIVEAVA